MTLYHVTYCFTNACLKLPHVIVKNNSFGHFRQWLCSLASIERPSRPRCPLLTSEGVRECASVSEDVRECPSVPVYHRVSFKFRSPPSIAAHAYCHFDHGRHEAYRVARISSSDWESLHRMIIVIPGSITEI